MSLKSLLRKFQSAPSCEMQTTGENFGKKFETMGYWKKNYQTKGSNLGVWKEEGGDRI